MKILFLNPPSPPYTNVYRDWAGGFGITLDSTRARYGHDLHASTLIPPLFFAYAAATLEKGGFESSILDAQGLNLDLSQVLGEVEKREPNIIVSRISLPSYKRDLGIFNHIKELLPNTLIIGWGTVCDVMPKLVLVYGGLDLVVHGELEFALHNIIEKLEKGNSLHNIEGISFKHDGGVICNRRSPMVENLDVLPIPAYHLLNMKMYVTEAKVGPSKGKFVHFFPVLTSRGCPYNCIYCPYVVAFGNVWRWMSPERVVEEIDHLVKNYHIRVIRFLDQTFTLDTKRATEICDEILKQGLDIQWECETRVDRLPRNLVAKMKKAGCVLVQLGVESGDPQLLDIAKPGSTLRAIEQTFRITKEEGILRRANVMVGMPKESWKTIKTTWRFIERIKPDDLEVDIVTPYPGTLFYEMAERKGWLITKNWEKYTIVKPVISLEGFTASDMLKARRYLLDRFRTKKKIKKIISAVQEWDFRGAAKEAKTTIVDIPNDLRRIYNLIVCSLK